MTTEIYIKDGRFIVHMHGYTVTRWISKVNALESAGFIVCPTGWEFGTPSNHPSLLERINNAITKLERILNAKDSNAPAI